MTDHRTSDRTIDLPIAPDHPALPDDAGQTTAEYALVLLGAAVVAGALMTWAESSGAIGALFDAVMGRIQGALG